VADTTRVAVRYHGPDAIPVRQLGTRSAPGVPLKRWPRLAGQEHTTAFGLCVEFGSEKDGHIRLRCRGPTDFTTLWCEEESSRSVVHRVQSVVVSGGYQRSELFGGPNCAAIREGQQRHRVSQPAALPAGRTLSCNESSPALRAVERQHFHTPAVPRVLNTPLDDGPTAITRWPGVFVH